MTWCIEYCDKSDKNQRYGRIVTVSSSWDIKLRQIYDAWWQKYYTIIILKLETIESWSLSNVQQYKYIIFPNFQITFLKTHQISVCVVALLTWLVWLRNRTVMSLHFTGFYFIVCLVLLFVLPGLIDSQASLYLSMKRVCGMTEGLSASLCSSYQSKALYWLSPWQLWWSFIALNV